MERPNPEQILNRIKNEEKNCKKGKLKIFFGYAAGVGKTYGMLQSAHELMKDKIDVVVGYIEPHTRPETMKLLDGLEILDTKRVSYRGIIVNEFDLDKAIERRPTIILVDELAHTNIKGMRHNKRWQDIEELLEAGINVYTTVNVQHIESLNDIVEVITKVNVRETIPDKIMCNANSVKLVDIEPEDLIERFREGKVYKSDQARKAEQNFFKKENLQALREIALRETAEKVNKDVQSSRINSGEMDILPTRDLLLACISSSPTSRKVIRTTARLADSLKCKWIAIYVDKEGIGFSDNDFDTLSFDNKFRENIKLVESLGGEIVFLDGLNVAEKIIEFSRIRNVTKIIIGRNHKVGIKKIIRYFKKDIVDEIMDISDNVEFHIIPSTVQKRENRYIDRNKLLEKVMDGCKFTYGDILKVSLIIGLCTIVSIVFESIGFTEHNILLVYIIGILFISINTNGYMVGIISAFINAIAFNYFFTIPRFTLTMDDSSYLMTLPFFVIASITTSTLTSKIREESKELMIKEKNSELLYQISKKFLGVVGRENIINHSIELISLSIEKDTIFYTKKGNSDKLLINYNKLSTIKEEDLKSERGIVEWVFKNNKEAGSNTETLPGARFYYIPLIGYGGLEGVLAIDCRNGVLKEKDRVFLEAIKAQMILAIDRDSLYEEQENNKIAIEREQLRNNLLRAISHDLRTPLTGIVGSSSLILENIDKLDNDTVLELLKGINEEGEWLIRLVENVLSMTKIEEGMLEVIKSDEIIEDIIYEALERINFRNKTRKIKVKTWDDLIIAPMDGKLICQVIINLVDNAIKYTPADSEIRIEVRLNKNFMVLEVIDNGNGIDEENLPYLFDQFFTVSNNCIDSKRGVGLGLAICKSIIRAHGGNIVARNNKTGGASFSFTLPMNSNDK